MKNLVILAASALGLALAQNNTYAGCLLSSPAYNATSGVSTYLFCSDNKCYTPTQNKNSSLTCVNKYTKEELVKRTTTFTHSSDVTITKLERDSVKITGVPVSTDGFLTLKNGQSARVSFYNKGDKSAFVDVEYKEGTTKKDDKKRVGFYVYNKATPDKVFDMSVAEKVLLPQSAANFQTVLVAEGGDFTFKLDFSGSQALMIGLLAALVAFVSYF